MDLNHSSRPGAVHPATLAAGPRRQIINLAQNAADGIELLLLDGSVVEVSRRRAQQFKTACGL